MAESQNRADRRQRRQQERRHFLSLTSLFVVVFLLSLSAALYVAWLVYPLEESTASPAVLRPEFKDDYIYMVSQGYAQDNDWARAQVRLNKLNDPDLANTTLALLESALREGRPPEAIRNLARLAERLGAEGETLALFAPTPVAGGEPAVLPTITPTVVTEESETAAGNTENDTAIEENGGEIEPTIELSATGSLTATAIAEIDVTATATIAADIDTDTDIEETPAAYRLLSQRDVCREGESNPRIEVIVVDAGLSELRGVEISLAWENGDDRAITGFKTNQSAGYADFTIDLEHSYTVTMSDGSGTAGGLQSGSCADGEGVINWVLRYQYLGNSE